MPLPIKQNKTKQPKQTNLQLAKMKGFWKHNDKNGLVLQGVALRILFKYFLSFKEKIVAHHLPLLLEQSISFNLSLHINYFIACYMEIPIPEQILFNLKMTEGNSQEIFCSVAVWEAKITTQKDQQEEMKNRKRWHA